MTTVVTFRRLEQRHAGGEWEPGSSSLDEWYEGIRDTPIEELSDGDLCRACRQQLYLDTVIPVAVTRLRLNPLAGDMYDGELVAALKAVPSDFWRTNPSQGASVRTITAQVLQENDDDEIASDIRQLLKLLPAP